MQHFVQGGCRREVLFDLLSTVLPHTSDLRLRSRSFAPRVLAPDLTFKGIYFRGNRLLP